jgi:diguanylate cyclase (GGDEF)-like protein
MHDDLTGLPNREQFLGDLAMACRTAAAGSLAVFFLDLDGFKQVNDQLGHGAGDALLRQVAERLQAAARPTDLVARLAGDEFAALVHLTPKDMTDEERIALVTAIGHRFIVAVNAPVPLGHTIQPRVSIGAAIGGDSADPETLQREADFAMYRAKQAGGNRVEIVDNVTDDLKPSCAEGQQSA